MDYSDRVSAYFDRARAAGPLAGRHGFCVSGSAGQESEGARIWLAARIVSGRVAEARFRAYGCPCTIALAAWAAEQIEGLAADGLRMDPLDAAAELGLPAEKLGRALCAEDALRDLRANWVALSQSKGIGTEPIYEEAN